MGISSRFHSSCSTWEEELRFNSPINVMFTYTTNMQMEKASFARSPVPSAKNSISRRLTASCRNFIHQITARLSVSSANDVNPDVADDAFVWAAELLYINISLGNPDVASLRRSWCAFLQYFDVGALFSRSSPRILLSSLRQDLECRVPWACSRPPHV